MFTVRETAKLFDISIRTLHFYDSIDLLKPTVVSDAGYRYYDGEAINALRQIIFLRKLEIPLKDIQNMLYNPDCDQRTVYETQLRVLEKRRNETDNLIGLIKKIVRSEIVMSEIVMSEIVMSEDMEKSRDLLKLDVILVWSTY